MDSQGLFRNQDFQLTEFFEEGPLERGDEACASLPAEVQDRRDHNLIESRHGSGQPGGHRLEEPIRKEVSCGAVGGVADSLTRYTGS
jgi:hypothetical protein